MVKSLDDKITPELIDHVGWQLWRASEQWSNRFKKAMVDAGYKWFAEARANVIPHLHRRGTRQSDLVTRLHLSKQAVQQFIDGLVVDGIVERAADPDDARGKVVQFTKSGLAALAAANRVKKQIEQEYEQRLGKTRFKQLCALLAEVNDLSTESDD